MRTKARLALFICLLSGVAVGQGPFYAAYVSNGSGGWTPYTNGSGQNAIGYQPPSAYLYCYSSGSWNACSNGGGGGTTTNALTLNNGGSGAASGSTFNGSAAVTLSYNTLGAQQALTLTTTGTSGAATLASGTLNIPQYSTLANALTMNSSGSGAASGSTFNGSSAQTISYNTLGAAGLTANNTFIGTNALQGVTTFGASPPTVTTPGTGYYLFGVDGTEPASISAGASGFVMDSTCNGPDMWANAVNKGCLTSQWSNSLSSTLTSPATTTSASLATLTLALPTVPISTTKFGHCDLIWSTSLIADAIQLGINTSAASTGFQILGSTTYPTATTVANLLPPAVVTTATTTAITASLTAAVGSTFYLTHVAFSLQTGASNPVTLTIYGSIASAGTLTLGAGSSCGFNP